MLFRHMMLSYVPAAITLRFFMMPFFAIYAALDMMLEEIARRLLRRVVYAACRY